MFHEDNRRFSVLPCSEGLIFSKRRATSEEDEGKDSMRVLDKAMKKKGK